MNYNDWKEKYKPIDNHIKMTPLYDGSLWGTTELETDRVNASSPGNVWSLLEENNVTWISPGVYNYPVTKGYFLTSRPWTVADKGMVVHLMEPLDIFVAHLGGSIGFEDLVDLRIRVTDAMGDSGLKLA